MSIEPVERRHFLTLLLASVLAPCRLQADPGERRGTFSADIGILYHIFTFRMTGEIQENIDRVGGRYNVRVSGKGDRISNRIESNGILRDGRWMPLRGASWFQVQGRESRLQIDYDYDRRVAEYHARGETFFRRRLRVVDDTIALPAGTPVDDGISAVLNYRDGYWTPRADGHLHSYVVRRRRAEDEGPDDVAPTYRAELVPLELRLEVDPVNHRSTAWLDLSRFSSWARAKDPTHIVFDADRRPELITGSMILGSSVRIRLT
jgi:hypothetical protein